MHTCPECGCACYCGGDIDDIDTGDEEAENGCTCCAEGVVEDDEYYDDVPRCPECDACITQGDAHDSECPYAM